MSLTTLAETLHVVNTPLPRAEPGRQNVLGVTQRSEGEGSRGYEERSAIADACRVVREENYVPHHHEGRRGDEQDETPVETPAEEGEENREEGTDDVWRYCVKLLRNNGSLGIDSLNNLDLVSLDNRY